MNIFYLSHNPTEAAIWLADTHIIKMPVEACQMLSTAHRVLDGTLEIRKTLSGRKTKYWKLDDEREDILYKACYVNHPCNKWVRESSSNYLWLYAHYMSMCNEYIHRYKKTERKVFNLQTALHSLPKNIPHNGLTPPALAISEEFKDYSDPVGSYQKFYKYKKLHLLNYKNRNKPTWIE